MSDYLQVFWDAFTGYAGWLARTLVEPGLHTFFWWSLLASVVVYGLELLFPWRKDQPRFRRDFWLDAFYILFNGFLFALVGYAGVSEVVVVAFDDLLRAVGIENTIAIGIRSWPVWAQLATLFVVRDFVQWNVHRLLHRVDWLWQFHKVHHSVRQMGFAAQMRFHWMEIVVYRSLQYLPLAMIGFSIRDFLVVDVFAFTIGHLGHANLYLPVGPLRYVLNTPQMHIWHHMKRFPDHMPYGVNYGLTLSLWDWLFGTVWWPREPGDRRRSGPASGRDIELGFDDVEQFPQTFLEQVTHPWSTRRRTGK